MNINWKLRLQNKVSLLAILGQIIAIVYMVLGMLGSVPSIGEDTVTTLAWMVVELLTLLGIVVDPTTDGIADSKQAQNYSEPRKDR